VAGDQVVLFVGLLTGRVIWWQGQLIRRQWSFKPRGWPLRSGALKRCSRHEVKAWLEDITQAPYAH
jgi:hypothetical protein